LAKLVARGFLTLTLPQYEDINDHRSYEHSLSSGGIEARNH